MNKYRTILICGGAGFIGTNISSLAHARKHEVIVLDNFSRVGVTDNAKYLKKLKIKVIKGDITKKSDLKKLPKINAIINLAANTGVPWSIKKPLYDFGINAYGALNVLELARSRGNLPVLFASTNKVYSCAVNNLPMLEKKTRYVWKDKNFKGISEIFPMDSAGSSPHSPYGCSKASADLYHQEYFHLYGVPTVINRMSCIYGLHQKGVEDQGWFWWFIYAKKNNLPLNIYGNGKQVRDTLFGKDLALLYLEELENIKSHQGQVYNVGGGQKNSVSLLEVINYLNQKGGRKLKLHFHNWREADHKIYISDIAKVTAKTHWRPRTKIFTGIDRIWDSLS